MMKAELLLEKVGSEAEKEELHKIMQRIEDAEALLIKAREYTQVEEMKELDFQEADIGEFIKVVVEDFSSMAKERGQEIRYEEKRVKAMVNPRIKDALSNLLSNAIKYSPPGSVIDIRMEDLEDRVRIAFKDQGEGIPDEYKEAVFGRMKRINREGVKGTGLGLAIVKKIVELHKGRVWVEDNTPKGSVFILELPKRQK
jgi:signal transduction histidine kinase